MQSLIKALASKAIAVGADYVQQQLLRELRQMDTQAARQRIAQYVAGLPVQARAALDVAMQALEKAESNPKTRQVAQWIRDALAQVQTKAGLTSFVNKASVVDEPTSGQAHPTPKADQAAPQARATPASTTASSDASPSFQDVEQQLSRLLPLPSDRQLAEFGSFWLAASDSQRQRIVTHLQQLQSYLDQLIDQHHASEHQAWGGSVEDHLAYSMAALSSGRRDPQWEQRLELLQAMRDLTGRLLDAAQRGLAAPMPAQTVAGDGPFIPDAWLAVLQRPPTGLTLEKLAILRQILPQMAEQGQVRAGRQSALEQLLDDLESVLVAQANGHLSAEQGQVRVQSLLMSIRPMMADPGPASRRLRGRAGELDRIVGDLRMAVMTAMQADPTDLTLTALQPIDAGLRLFRDGLTDDAGSLVLAEQQVLRPKALDWHQWQLRNHLMLVQPFWDCTGKTAHAQPNGVFFGGGDDLAACLSAVADQRGLELLARRRLQHFGQTRWDQMRAAHVVVLDFRGAGRAGLSAQTSAQQATAAIRRLWESAYELGWALALGRPVVIVAGRQDRLPFDIDLSPLELDDPLSADDPNVSASVMQALDEALYETQRTISPTGCTASWRRLKAAVADHPKVSVYQQMGWLKPALQTDGQALQAAMQQVLMDLQDGNWQMIQPWWPPSYSPSQLGRLKPKGHVFHVMPFGPAWADQARNVARKVTQAAGCAYRRGDEAEEGRIVRAIWDDIASAERVLVDLTGCNLNVLIELGIAHVLGKPVLLVQQAAQGQAGLQPMVPKHLEKQRVLMYGAMTGADGLEGGLQAWLSKDVAL